MPWHSCLIIVILRPTTRIYAIILLVLAYTLQGNYAARLLWVFSCQLNIGCRAIAIVTAWVNAMASFWEKSTVTHSNSSNKKKDKVTAQ